VMAKDAIDEAVRGLDERVPESVTAKVPLVGAEGWHALLNQRQQLADQSGLHVARIDHLLHRYGSLISEVLDLIAADPKLAEPLPGVDDYLQVEAVYAASHEGARHLDDVLARRTRASIEAWDRGVTAAPVVAALIAPILGWDAEKEKDEVTHYLARVAAERESQEQPDDATADAVRLGAADVVPSYVAPNATAPVDARTANGKPAAKPAAKETAK
jgi:glycerol-3-phosphate dehydrogenase